MFSDPEKNIKQFSIGEDWRVADFGTGSGAYALAAAEYMDGEGEVYAIDINEGLLDRLKKEAGERRIRGIRTVLGDIEAPGGVPLQDGRVDGAIAANVFFQVENKKALIGELWRVLRRKGRVLVVDWSDSHGGIGPHSSHVITEDALRKLFEEGGFSYEKDIDAGAHHYGLVFKKEDK